MIISPSFRVLAPMMALLALHILPQKGFAQDEVKAAMAVQNYRNEVITMNFSYVFGDYSWALMERDIPIDGDLTYKFPTGLPGCSYLIDWEIDDALLTISSSQGVICQQQVSLCEKKEINIEVKGLQCYTRAE